MANDSTRRQPQTIFAGAPTNNSVNVPDTSRLLNDSQGIRNALESRNLYTPDVEYPLNPNSAQKVVNALSNIGTALAPFSGVDLKNTVVGRIASSIGNSSPLSEIGLVMLGKQFVMNSASHLQQTYMPTIDLSGFMKGGKLFKKAIDYSITVTPQTGFQTFLENLAGGNTTYKNPFTANPTNAEIIKNTGTAQLNYLYTSINQNIYKQDDTTLTQYGVISQTPILPRTTITATQTYFNFNSDKEYPYMAHHPSGQAAVTADDSMRESYKAMAANGQEYAPDADFINNNFGNTDKTHVYDGQVKDSFNDWVSTNTEFGDDDIRNKLVWGRDGLDPLAEKKLGQLRGDSDPAGGQITPEAISSFKIKGGLLEYTRNLLNATEGTFVDITRKAFKDGNTLVGFNGAGLWRAPFQEDSKYAANSGNAGKQGVRQHTVLDQYDKFAKTIRFMGNQVYGGNENSVIYKTVLPRIHPTLDKNGKPDPRNLMFSIENLAIRVLSKDTYGIIDDEYGSPIPACEIGPFNGRIMWFPPYNLEINETGTAKFEATSIIGRNEPMYNYMSSERSATLSFTLLVDYPQQLRNFANSTNRQRDIAQFFAFGGNPYVDKFVSVENYEFKIAKLTAQIEQIKGRTVPAEPNEIQPVRMKIVFPNDVPTLSDNLSTIIDDLYKKYTYEIIQGLPSSDVTSFGLNNDIFFKEGIIDLGNVDGEQKYALDTSAPSQYTSVALNDQFGENKLNSALFNVFNDANNRISYSVYIHGAASKLYLAAGGTQYNKKLGERRAQALQALVQKKLASMFGQSIANGIEVTWDTVLGESVGDVQASQDNATKAAIPYKATKEERYAYLEIKKNSRTLPPTKSNLNPTDVTNIIKLQAEIEAAKVQMQKIKDNQSCVYKERGSDTSVNTAILHGFDSVSGNYFYPVFHSQTPEDFHKRLTFLHQCQRQGAAKRWDNPVSGENSAMARNSVFGRQPICILRVGDFFYTKVVIENYTIDYSDTTWDMNPEGFGMQPMLAKVTLQMKLMGGESLKGPIDALQNAVSFNYYANSSFTDAGMYKLPSKVADQQESYIKEILTAEQAQLNKTYDERTVQGVISSVINNGLLLV
jgi:hypothetical protein